ncbi:MAG TPA: hypothetical protein H9881_17990 [Candidatus Stackebrandtia excrementipullorum]|nr:hypothetical protein [Candidatus Stackebrandtia excrementipullorum]
MSRFTAGALRAKGNDVRDALTEALARMFSFGSMTLDVDEVNEAFGPVVEWFTRFADSDPERLEAMRDSLRHTTASLKSPDLEKIDTVHDTVAAWRGPAADSFFENFVTPFGRIHQNHVELSMELDAALTAAITIIDNGRHDAATVADNAVEMFNAMDSGGGGGGLSMALTIVGAVAGVAGTVATGGTAAVAWALIGGTASVGAAATAPTATIGGNSLEEGLESVRLALADIHTAMQEEEVILAEALLSDLSAVSSDDLFLPNPVILTNPGSRTGEFRLPAGVGD